MFWTSRRHIVLVAGIYGIATAPPHHTPTPDRSSTPRQQTKSGEVTLQKTLTVHIGFFGVNVRRDSVAAPLLRTAGDTVVPP